MNRGKTIVALAMGALLTVSSLTAFAACGGDDGTKDMTEVVGARICYDNLPDDGISLAETDTKYPLEGAVSRVEYDATGAEVAAGTVVDYAEGVVTAKATGKAVFTLEGDKTFTVEVVPAYVTNPHHQYNTQNANDSGQGSKYLGFTHDPSILETVEDGKTVYYICSTGWQYGNEIRRSEDLIHWDYIGKTMSAKTSMRAVEEWEEVKNDGAMSWWAPDIVPAYGGGYWLYTCVVSGDAATASKGYSRACILLFHSDTMQPESFRYQGVLMQSSIPNGSDGEIDVNSIDPQIIYSADGKMYMAYGSFGTGNWMLELNPKTGLRKDNFYKDKNSFLSVEKVREYEAEAESEYMNFLNRGETVKSKFYGTLISLGAMEAPVIARHDHLTLTDQNGQILKDADGNELKDKTYYYSMHSFNPLDVAYQMWGGRCEDVWGVYRPVNGTAESKGIVYNAGVGAGANSGNKYMGRFQWSDAVSSCIVPVKTGHNDLFTSTTGLNIAAYITRTSSFGGTGEVFLSQTHQYYLNSMGDIVINPNRYGGEVSRSVSQEELLRYTDGGKFKLIALANDDILKESVEVVLTEDNKITLAGEEIGTWKIYGAGYIYIRFTNIDQTMLSAARQTEYYGVVRPTWLDDQNKSGFTITCMGHTKGSGNVSCAMFMNSVSSMTGEDFVG